LLLNRNPGGVIAFDLSIVRVSGIRRGDVDLAAVDLFAILEALHFRPQVPDALLLPCSISC